MSSPQAVQFIYVPHRPVHSDEEINKDLAPALSVLFKYVPWLFPMLSSGHLYIGQGVIEC